MPSVKYFSESRRGVRVTLRKANVGLPLQATLGRKFFPDRSVIQSLTRLGQ